MTCTIKRVKYEPSLENRAIIFFTRLQELANILMHEDFHGRDLESYPREVLPQLLLVHDLDRHFLARDRVRCQFDLSKAAGADRLV